MKDKETPEFVKWFENSYGKSTDYDDSWNEQDEYWRRRGFALMGWLAALERPSIKPCPVCEELYQIERHGDCIHYAVVHI